VDPLKAAAATLFCLVLFWVVLRITRRLMEMAIAAGHAAEHRRVEEEARAAAELGEPVAGPAPPPAAHAAGAVP
jgi:hypothetical protein